MLEMKVKVLTVGIVMLLAGFIIFLFLAPLNSALISFARARESCAERLKRLSSEEAIGEWEGRGYREDRYYRDYSAHTLTRTNATDA